MNKEIFAKIQEHYQSHVIEINDPNNLDNQVKEQKKGKNPENKTLNIESFLLGGSIVILALVIYSKFDPSLHLLSQALINAETFGTKIANLATNFIP